MSSHDRKLLKEFYRDFPVVVISVCGFGRSHKTANRDIFADPSQIANQKSIYRFANPLSNRQSKKSQIHNPQSKIE
ncbi:hypothetical protein C7B67_08075 [filamentous cyanobacterium Phorm 6]|nr:hypothetical protein C7B67_08075 [filamentous cyanobacterium Phorm 6]